MSIHPCPIPRCRDPRDPDGNAPLIDDPLCPHHHQKVVAAIAASERTYDALGDALGDASGRDGAGGFTTGTKSPPLPINVHVRACQESLVRALVLVEDAHRHARGFTRVRFQGRERHRVVRASSFAAAHLEEILARDYGLVFAVEILRVVGDAARTLGLTRLFHRLPAPCPGCDLMLLQREDGSEWVTCRGCMERWDEPAYRRLCAVLAADVRDGAR